MIFPLNVAAIGHAINNGPSVIPALVAVPPLTPCTKRGTYEVIPNIITPRITVVRNLDMDGQATHDVRFLLRRGEFHWVVTDAPASAPLSTGVFLPAQLAVGCRASVLARPNCVRH